MENKVKQVTLGNGMKVLSQGSVYRTDHFLLDMVSCWFTG